MKVLVLFFVALAARTLLLSAILCWGYNAFASHQGWAGIGFWTMVPVTLAISAVVGLARSPRIQDRLAEKTQ